MNPQHWEKQQRTGEQKNLNTRTENKFKKKSN